MGLFKTAAKVAVASSVHGRVQRRQAQRWAAKDQAAAQAAPQPVAPAAPGQPLMQAAPPQPMVQAPPAPPAPPAAAEDAMQRKIALLTQLGELRTAGVLTDAEFEVQKAAILAG